MALVNVWHCYIGARSTLQQSTEKATKTEEGIPDRFVPRIGLRMDPSPKLVVMRRMAVVASELHLLCVSVQYWGCTRESDVRDRGNERPKGGANEGEGRRGPCGGSKDRREDLRTSNGGKNVFSWVK